MKKRIVTTVAIRNNPTSVPPLGLAMKINGKLIVGKALAALFLFFEGSGGAGGYTYAATLPSGMTLDTSTGAVSGTPDTLGHYVFSATVTDAETNSYTNTFTLDVIAQMNFESEFPLPDGETLVPYSYQFEVSGNAGAVTYAITSGSIPGDISLTSGGLLGGTHFGTNRYAFTVTATDTGTGDTLDIGCSLNFVSGMNLTADNPAYYFTGGVFGTQHFSLTGGIGNYVLSNLNNVPDGLLTTFDLNSGGLTIYDVPNPPTFSGVLTSFVTGDITDSLGAVYSFSVPVTVVAPQTALQAKDGGSDLGGINPLSIKIESSDGTVDVSGSNVAGAVVYDLSVGDSSGGTGSPIQFQDAGGNIGSPDPAHVKIISSDASVDVDGHTDSSGTVVYDLSTSTSSGSGGGGTVAGMPIWPTPHIFNASDSNYAGYSLLACCTAGWIVNAASTFKVSLNFVTSGATVKFKAVLLRVAKGSGTSGGTVVDNTPILFSGNSNPTLSVTGGSLDAVSDTIALAIDPQYDHWFIVALDASQPATINLGKVAIGLWQFLGTGTPESWWVSGYLVGDQTGVSTIPSTTPITGVVCFHDALLVT